MNTSVSTSIVFVACGQTNSRRIGRALAAANLDIKLHIAESSRELEDMLLSTDPAVVLFNQEMAPQDMAHTAEVLNQKNANTPLIAVSSSDNPLQSVAAVQAGARDIVNLNNLPMLVVSVAREAGLLDALKNNLAQQDALGPDTDQELPSDCALADEGILIEIGSDFCKLLAYPNTDLMIGTLIMDHFVTSEADSLRNSIRNGMDKQEASKQIAVSAVTAEGEKISTLLDIDPAPEHGEKCLRLRLTVADQISTAETQQETAQEKPAVTAAQAETRPPAAKTNVSSKPVPTATQPDPDNPWSNRLKRALEQDEFALASQRISELVMGDSPQIEHMDILVRLLLRLRDQGKEVLPGKFLGAASEAGLLPAIDRWVIQHACQLMNEHQEDGRNPLFFLRMTTPTLREADITDWVSAQVEKSGHAASSLSFEMPEEDIFNDWDNSIAGLKRLQDLGCKLTISQFGATDDSQRLLDALKVDYIKFRSEDIRQLGQNQGTLDKISKLVTKTSPHGIMTIAPQVESAAALAALWQCGVNYAQGYFMKEPEIVLST